MAGSSRSCQRVLVQFARSYSSGGVKHHKLVVAGGGTGGCAVAARACRALGQGNVAIIEPAQVSRSNQLLVGILETIPQHCIGQVLII